jgi:hypothetical protein
MIVGAVKQHSNRCRFDILAAAFRRSNPDAERQAARYTERRGGLHRGAAEERLRHRAMADRDGASDRRRRGPELHHARANWHDEGFEPQEAGPGDHAATQARQGL